jgi:hypothetical protein
MEAMHGALPLFVYDDNNMKEKNYSLSKFVMYYASSIPFNFSPHTQNPQRLTRKEVWRKLVFIARTFSEASLLYSLLLPFHYQPFPSRKLQSLLDLFYWGNLINNFLAVYLLGLVLEAGFAGVGLLTALASGISTMHISDRPFSAGSPSEFWGLRWNKVVASALRRGVYRPLRSCGFARHWALLCTFVASDLVHEYVLWVMTLRGGVPNNPTKAPFVPSYGLQLMFFLWNGMLILIEQYMVAESRAIRWLRTHAPPLLKTLLLLSTVVPVAHLFTDQYIASCFYSDFALGFPIIVPKVVQ